MTIRPFTADGRPSREQVKINFAPEPGGLLPEPQRSDARESRTDVGQGMPTGLIELHVFR
jgi:hypothetical protein